MTTELVPLNTTAVQLFSENGLDPILDKIKKEIDSFVPDVESIKGRKAIASFAHKIAQSKTFIEKHGKELVSEIKAKSKLIDAERKRSRDTLDLWKSDVRKPLTEWEASEELRKEKELFDKKYELDWDEAHKEHAIVLREKELERKEAEIAKAEADRKEKEEAEQADKDRIANEARIKKEAEVKAQNEAKDAIENAKIKRITDLGLVYDGKQWANGFAHIAVIDLQTFSDEKFDDTINKIKKEIVNQANLKAKRDDIAAKEKAEAEKVAAVQKAKDDAAAKVKADQIEADRVAAEEKAKADKKAANTRHQAHVNNKVKECLMKTGITEKQATDIVIEIAQKRVEFLEILY